MFKKNKKGELTVRYLIGWAMFVFIYFTVVVGWLVTARESVLSILNPVETILAGLLVLAPMGGAIYDLYQKKEENNYSNDEYY